MDNKNKIYYVSKQLSFEKDDVKTFCSLTGDCQNIHLNPKKAKKGVYGRIIIPGILLSGKIPEMHFDILRNKEKITSDIDLILKKITARFFRPVFLGEKVKYYWNLKSIKKHRLGLEKKWKIVLKGSNKLKAHFEIDTIYSFR